jgi:hypothetical protein
MTHWYEDHSNVLRLATWLEDGYTAEQLLRFIEKPWKWAPEWEKLTRCKVCHEQIEDGSPLIACDFCDVKIHRDCAGIVGGYHCCGECGDDAKDQAADDRRERDEFERDHRAGSC